MEYIEEGIKDNIKNAKDKVLTPERKEKLNNTADKFNNSMNKRADFVASKIVKAPSKNASPEVYQKYKKDMMRWKATYKVGEIMAMSAIAIGPIDFVVKSATVSAMSRSNDPLDKAVMNKMKTIQNKGEKLKEKSIEFANKIKDKALDKLGIEKYIGLLDSMASDVARSVDSVKSQSENTPVVESCNMDLFVDNIITNNESDFGIEVYEAVRRFIDRCDYTNSRDRLISESCIEILMKDCYFK